MKKTFAVALTFVAFCLAGCGPTAQDQQQAQQKVLEKQAAEAMAKVKALNFAQK